MTIKDAAKELGCHFRTVERMIKRGQLVATKSPINGTINVDETSIAAAKPHMDRTDRSRKVSK